MNLPRWKPDALPIKLYRAILKLYPRPFKERYSAEMLDAARSSFAESAQPTRFTVELACDAAASLFHEHRRAASLTAPGFLATCAVFLSAVLLSLNLVHQQSLRREADRQPEFLARLVAGNATNGTFSITFERSGPVWPGAPIRNYQSLHTTVDEAGDVAVVFNGDKQDLASEDWLRSGSTFVATYDNDGNAIAGNAMLHGELPQPPRGIFQTIQRRGVYKVTWQPERSIRVALTGLPLPTGGFVVAGQSLIPSESQDADFNTTLLWMWVAMLGAILTIPILKRRRLRVSNA